MLSTDNILQNIHKLKQCNNVGKKWTKYDEDYLLKCVSQNKSLSDTAQLLHRNSGGIIAKLKSIATKMNDFGYSQENIKKTCKLLTSDDLNKIINPQKQHNNMDDISLSLRMITMMNLIKNNYDYNELKELSNDIFKNSKKDVSTQTEKECIDIIFSEKILNKMKKYKNNKHKLKKIRKKYNIGYKIFYSKLKSIIK